MRQGGDGAGQIAIARDLALDPLGYLPRGGPAGRGQDFQDV
jgi:hypothetical protein